MIAYDANILIYFLENNSEFRGIAEKIIRHADGTVVSVLIYQEVLTGVALNGDAEQLAATSLFLENLPRTVYVPVSYQITQKAIELTRMCGRKLRSYDAIHLATALEHGAEAFYTNDQDLLTFGVVDGLPLCPPKDYTKK